MSIPRITLWTPPIQIPVRLSEIGFDGGSYTDQANQVQNKSEQITITPGAMYILSGIAGRRIVEPVRWVLLDGLHDILLGDLRTETPERQDLLASTFGEILGALILSLKLGGDVEIVRLLESNKVQTPDFIILHWANPDKKMSIHLLECKGCVLDVNNLNHSRKVDVCRQIRNFKKNGYSQLENVKIHELTPGLRLRMVHKDWPLGLAGQLASKNLSVIAIPDGRILRLLDTGVVMPTRACCGGAGIDCVQCMTDRNNPSSSNIIAILHQEVVEPDSVLEMQTQQFIRQYQNAQRALWAEHDYDLVESTIALFSQLRVFDLPADLRTTLGLITASILEAGINQELEVSELMEVNWHDLVAGSDVLENILRELQAEIRREKRQSKKAVTKLSPEQMLEEVSRARPRPDNFALSTKYLSQDKDLFPSHPPVRDDEFPDPNSFGTPMLQISTVKETFGDAEVIRLTANQSSAQAYAELRHHTERIIRNLRRGYAFGRHAENIAWQDEYVQLNSTRINLGCSWDPYPYPHRTNQIPGITAWVARDGRAEIIVRHPEPRRD